MSRSRLDVNSEDLTTLPDEEKQAVPTVAVIVISIVAVVCSVPLILSASLVISIACRRKQFPV